jgi:hypothetical protein
MLGEVARCDVCGQPEAFYKRWKKDRLKCHKFELEWERAQQLCWLLVSRDGGSPRMTQQGICQFLGC